MNCHCNAEFEYNVERLAEYILKRMGINGNAFSNQSERERLEGYVEKVAKLERREPTERMKTLAEEEKDE